MDPVVGYEKILKNITLDDVYNWIEKYYHYNNMSIAISTNLSSHKIKKILNNYMNNRFNRDNLNKIMSESKKSYKNND